MSKYFCHGSVHIFHRQVFSFTKRTLSVVLCVCLLVHSAAPIKNSLMTRFLKILCPFHFLYKEEAMMQESSGDQDFIMIFKYTVTLLMGNPCAFMVM